MFGFDDIASTILDAGLGFLGSSLLADNANENSAEQALRAFEQTQQAYGTRYQTTVQDMRAAGLNPILAASGGFNVGNSPIAPMAQTFQGNMSGTQSISSTAKNYQDIEQSKKQMEKIDAEKNEIIQNIENKKQEVKESIERIAKTRAETGKITQEEMDVECL